MSELALASANEKFVLGLALAKLILLINGIAVSGANICDSCAHLCSSVILAKLHYFVYERHQSCKSGHAFRDASNLVMDKILSLTRASCLRCYKNKISCYKKTYFCCSYSSLGSRIGGVGKRSGPLSTTPEKLW